MSGALVKWNGGQMVKPSPVGRCRAAREAALALLRPAPVLPARTNGNGSPAIMRAGDVVDVPHICSVREEPYVARYVIGADGRYRYAQTIKVTEALFLGLYAGNPHRAVVPCEATAEETCPWCGASGFGSIRCGVCHCEICYGRTAGLFFRCRPSCPGQGNMVWISEPHEGVKPSETRRRWGTR